MQTELWIGLAFAVGTALATNLAFLWKHRGAVAAPAIDMRRPVRSAADLFRSKWWAVGWSVAVVGWVLHVGAITFAPLSLAQAVISGGFVLLAVVAERWFGFSLERRQWIGVGVIAAGLGILGATTDAYGHDARYSIVGIAVFQGALLIIGLLLVLATRHAALADGGDETRRALEAPVDEAHPRTGGPPQAPVTAHGTSTHRSKRAGIVLGAAAGLAFGVSSVSIKALAESVFGDVTAIVSPWTVTAVLASVGAFYASARSLQIGDAIAVITATSAAANLSTIAGGIVVFGEPIGDGALEIAARTTAFLLVVIGAAMMPGPMRAAEAGAEEERAEQRQGARSSARASARSAGRAPAAARDR